MKKSLEFLKKKVLEAKSKSDPIAIKRAKAIIGEVLDEENGALTELTKRDSEEKERIDAFRDEMHSISPKSVKYSNLHTDLVKCIKSNDETCNSLQELRTNINELEALIKELE